MRTIDDLIIAYSTGKTVLFRLILLSKVVREQPKSCALLFLDFLKPFKARLGLGDRPKLYCFSAFKLAPFMTMDDSFGLRCESNCISGDSILDCSRSSSRYYASYNCLTSIVIYGIIQSVGVTFIG